jgi:hypothetical protein
VAERNTLPTELEGVKGAQELLDWFGYWPNFHDAEVTSVQLNRAGTSSLAVHVWQTTDRVDAQGYFARQKHAVVSFLLSGISELELAEFNHQNVLGSLNLTSKDSAFELTLESIYGLAGKVTALRVEINFVPGEPAEVGPSNDAGRPTRGRARPLTKAEQLRLKSET